MRKVYEALREHRYEDAKRRMTELERTAMHLWYVQHFSDELRQLRRLFKETKLNDVLLVAEQLGEIASAAFPKDSFIASQYGWILYDRYMKSNDVETLQKERAATWILTHTTQGTYSPFEATIWRLLPLYEEKSIASAYELLQRLDRRTLSRDELRVRQAEAITYPSSREKYYVKWIAYTWELNDMRTCYKACYELMYTSGVTVRQPLPIYEKMVQALRQQGREREAEAFVRTLVDQYGYTSLVRYIP